MVDKQLLEAYGKAGELMCEISDSLPIGKLIMWFESGYFKFKWAVSVKSGCFAYMDSISMYDLINSTHVCQTIMVEKWLSKYTFDSKKQKE